MEDDARYVAAYRHAQQALAAAVPRGGRRWRREDLYER
jgi:hypothetical protein